MGKCYEASQFRGEVQDICHSAMFTALEWVSNLITSHKLKEEAPLEHSPPILKQHAMT